MILAMDMSIPHTETNHFVSVPTGDADSWLGRMRQSLDEEQAISMRVDNLAHGCDGVAIAFTPPFPDKQDPDDRAYKWLSEGDAFGFVLSKTKLAEMIRMLQYAYENFDGKVPEAP